MVSMQVRAGGLFVGGSLVGYQVPKLERAHDFEEPRICKLGSKARSNSRIKFASNESKLAPRNLDNPGSPPSKVGLRM